MYKIEDKVLELFEVTMWHYKSHDPNPLPNPCRNVKRIAEGLKVKGKYLATVTGIHRIIYGSKPSRTYPSVNSENPCFILNIAKEVVYRRNALLQCDVTSLKTVKTIFLVKLRKYLTFQCRWRPQRMLRIFCSSQATCFVSPYLCIHLRVPRNENPSVFSSSWIWIFLSLLVTWCTKSLTFNNCMICPHCIYVFCIYPRTNSDLCHLQHKLIGFYNRDEKCLLRGTKWVFK